MKSESGYTGRIERISADCRRLYAAHGYRRYKMSRFEEYDLYAANKDFLVSDSIITFTERNGKLMALKPDVTLSIVKNAAAEPNGTEKVYYSENVFRTDRGSSEFREITQLGLECIGDITLYSVSEVITLAQKSLAAISPRSLLDISHTGFVSGLIEAAGIDGERRSELIRELNSKNTAGVKAVCDDCGISEELTSKLAGLTGICGSFAEEIAKLETLSYGDKCSEAIGELRELYHLLDAAGAAKQVNLDFTLDGGLKYYNGVTFRGYVEGIPFTVLSGGRYDKLLYKLGKRGGAVGFAIYLDRLEALTERSDGYDVDVLLLYGKDTDGAKIAKTVERLISEGKSVRADSGLPGSGLRWREIIEL